MIQRYFPALSSLGNGTPRSIPGPVTIIQNLTQAYKLRYLEALFVPVAFLPLLSLPELIPAIPCLAISLLSSNPDYSSIDAQYSASVIAPVFAAFFLAVARFPRVLGEGTRPIPVLGGIAVVSLFATFGLGATPLSGNFWSASWGGRWHVAQYRPDRGQALDRATALIPTDPNIVVVTQNDINSKPLAHRSNFFAFPYALERADYVLLDTGRQPYVYWTWDPQGYRAILKELKDDPTYQTVFDEDGVLLLERRKENVRSTHAYGFQ